MKKITDIPKDKKYIGYLWMSDQKYPTEFREPTMLEEELSIDEKTNPFIIEGQLYCEEESGLKKSYSIKYVDGEYWVTEYDLNKLKTRKDFVLDDMKQVKSFIPNRFQVSKLTFAQYWQESKPDELCEGMKVLIPGPFVFIGF